VRGCGSSVLEWGRIHHRPLSWGGSCQRARRWAARRLLLDARRCGWNVRMCAARRLLLDAGRCGWNVRMCAARRCGWNVRMCAARRCGWNVRRCGCAARRCGWNVRRCGCAVRRCGWLVDDEIADGCLSVRILRRLGGLKRLRCGVLKQVGVGDGDSCWNSSGTTGSCKAVYEAWSWRWLMGRAWG
jgi:hypothetical protein